MGWKLKRTKQCAKCPWRKDVNPRDIPNNYCELQHAALQVTIASEPSLASISQPLHVMTCHETKDAHCVGWLVNQLGPGNNIALRLRMLDCDNRKKLDVVGEQHMRFEDTLPEPTEDTDV